MRRFVCLASRVARSSSSSGALSALQNEQAFDGMNSLSNMVKTNNLHVWAGGGRKLSACVQAETMKLNAGMQAPLRPSDISIRMFTEELRVLHPELVAEPMYHQLADRTLDFLQEKLEAFVEDHDIEGSDVEYGQGVLTVCLGQHGTYVINKQTPNRQIWLSSPVSGPLRYDCVSPPEEGSSPEDLALRCSLLGRWVYHRDGRELLTQLDQEMTRLVGASPHLSGEQ
ncbi:hypothetical protein DUNSADRAFT_10066 [Dunaliella salina]|uniref:ferroxidase n=1 Tax=Dunaliella salina TaxID=3046 RepID=A0ABQ7GG44_DUNSA|nr:hypothetical protein DUNSADRAFT_10066 [Dunaliella salina]|eukprot:KAF5833575.1 hypothetical protein DUNSADRAFT_10066 [Dunaliella salina]